MRGRHIGRLNVYTQTQTNESIVWSKAGTQGNKWLKGQVNLLSNQNFIVIFEGVCGNGFYVKKITKNFKNQKINLFFF